MYIDRDHQREHNGLTQVVSYNNAEMLSDVTQARNLGHAYQSRSRLILSSRSSIRTCQDDQINASYNFLASLVSFPAGLRFDTH